MHGEGQSTGRSPSGVLLHLHCVPRAAELSPVFQSTSNGGLASGERKAKSWIRSGPQREVKGDTAPGAGSVSGAVFHWD